MQASPFDAVVFDLDGTLVDSRIAVIEAVASGILEAAREAGLPEPEIERTLLRAALGRPAPEYFRAILPATLHHLADSVQEAATRHEVDAFENGRGRLYPGVEAALDRLRAAGIRIGVVSNAQAPYFRAALRHTPLNQRVDYSECHEELPCGVGPPWKLSLLTRALDALGVEPSRVMMVGDRGEDIQAGRAAGCPTLAIPFGFGDEEELADADDRLEHFDALASLVGA